LDSDIAQVKSTETGFVELRGTDEAPPPRPSRYAPPWSITGPDPNSMSLLADCSTLSGLAGLARAPVDLVPKQWLNGNSASHARAKGRLLALQQFSWTRQTKRECCRERPISISLQSWDAAAKGRTSGRSVWHSTSSILREAAAQTSDSREGQLEAESRSSDSGGTVDQALSFDREQDSRNSVLADSRTPSPRRQAPVAAEMEDSRAAVSGSGQRSRDSRDTPESSFLYPPDEDMAGSQEPMDRQEGQEAGRDDESSKGSAGGSQRQKGTNRHEGDSTQLPDERPTEGLEDSPLASSRGSGRSAELVERPPSPRQTTQAERAPGHQRRQQAAERLEGEQPLSQAGIAVGAVGTGPASESRQQTVETQTQAGAPSECGDAEEGGHAERDRPRARPRSHAGAQRGESMSQTAVRQRRQTHEIDDRRTVRHREERARRWQQCPVHGGRGVAMDASVDMSEVSEDEISRSESTNRPPDGERQVSRPRVACPVHQAQRRAQARVTAATRARQARAASTPPASNKRGPQRAPGRAAQHLQPPEPRRTASSGHGRRKPVVVRIAGPQVEEEIFRSSWTSAEDGQDDAQRGHSTATCAMQAAAEEVDHQTLELEKLVNETHSLLVKKGLFRSKAVEGSEGAAAAGDHDSGAGQSGSGCRVDSGIGPHDDFCRSSLAAAQKQVASNSWQLAEIDAALDALQRDLELASLDV